MRTGLSQPDGNPCVLTQPLNLHSTSLSPYPCNISIFLFNSFVSFSTSADSFFATSNSAFTSTSCSLSLSIGFFKNKNLTFYFCDFFSIAASFF